MCAGDYRSRTSFQHAEWGVGQEFKNVSQTEYGQSLPDIVTVLDVFNDRGCHIQMSDSQGNTIEIRFDVARCVYAPTGNKPEIF